MKGGEFKMIKNLKVQVKEALRQLKTKKSGQTLVEYALILAFIAVVAIVVLQALGTQVKSKFSQISSALQNAS